MPIDAQYLQDGIYYKVGCHGLAFRWNGQAWIKSSKRPAQLKAMASAKAGLIGDSCAGFGTTRRMS